MSQETPAAHPASTAAEQPVPTNLPIELLPLYDWWKANGNQFLITLTTVLVLAGGAFAFRQYHTSRLASANKELVRASTVEDLEAAVNTFGGTKAGNAIRLRLAKSYYDAARYEEALNTYDACLSKGAPAGFAEIARLGRAHALEGLNRLDEAFAAYEAFNKTAEGHFLQPLAQMGMVRIYTLQGKKAEAQKLLENLKAQKTSDSAWEMALANLEGVVNRYEPRAARSLFDAANEAAKKAAPAAAPEPAPAAK